jgi:hypothetical protein
MRPFLPPIIALAFAAGAVPAAAQQPVYLNIEQITVEIGRGSTFTTDNNTFSRGYGLEKVIDAPSAAAEEVHDQDTHLWFTGGVLELVFSFDVNYDITTLHFWNYNGEDYDVDRIEFAFYDKGGTLLRALTVEPALGSTPAIRAEDIPLDAPLSVRTVIARLSGSNGQIDFQNMGFTATVSAPDPNDPLAGAPVKRPLQKGDHAGR